MICWSFFIQGFYNIGVTLEAKKENFFPEILTVLISKIISIGITIWLAFELNNYWALAIGMIASEVAYVLLSYAFAKPFIPCLTQLSKLSDLMNFSKWIFFQQNVDFFNAKLFQFTVSKLFDTKYLGFFSLGSNLSFIYVSEVSSAVDKSNLSHLSKKLQYSDVLNKSSLVLDNLNYIFDLKHVLIPPVYICLAAYPNIFIEIILGSQWLEMAPFLTAFSISMILIGYIQTLSNIPSLSVSRHPNSFRQRC